MEYKLEKYKEVGYMGLRLSYSHLGMLQRFYDLMDKPEKVDILIDTEKKIIALDIQGTDFKISSQNTYHRINSRRLHQKLPQGRYVFKKREDKKFICVLETPQRT